MDDTQFSMPAVLDRQIEDESQDAFGHRHFAHALRSLIESECHKPPFSIGLLGGWGTGKSSIKELYTRSLVGDGSTSSGTTGRKDRIKSITFNAWRFGGKDQDIKRALLRHVFLELGGDEKALHDKLFKNVTNTEQHWKGWKEYAAELWRAWSMPLPAFLAAIALLYVLVWLILQILPWNNATAQAIVIASISGAYSYLLKSLKPSKIDSFRSVTKVSLPSASAEQYEEMLLEQLHVFKAKPPGFFGKAPSYERLVIFVDDLDRLSAEEMVLGLDAVRAFMEIPPEKLPSGLGLVFVISCDEAKVADALARGRNANPEQPGTVFNHSAARRYLDRIFQFRLEIPPPPRGDMRQFALKHLSSFDDIAADLKARGMSPEQVVDRMIHVNVIDPRNALQIVNAFAQSWWLAKRREREGSASHRPGGLHESAVTGHPISLGALSAARVSFPDFYKDLQEDSQLLDRLTAVLVHDKSVMDQPIEARPLLLKRYVTFDDVNGTKLRPDCRPLRQFLASLVGIRWPESLQSLLLLSEDPITRKFGGSATTLYGLLVSGDTNGIIEQLSPRVDKVVLTEDQAHLLHQMISDLHLESEDRRHNAMRVVADVIGYLPQRTVRLVLGTLCTELAASVRLRSMVGLPNISSIVALANSQEQRQIASVLVDDLLTTGHPIEFRKESMQTPNLDEAKDLVSQACAIVLRVRDTYGLNVKEERALIEWLKVRDVHVGSQSFHFSFGQLESWLESYEESLLPALGTDYVSLVADEVESGRTAQINTSSVADRVDVVFSKLAEAGEESRSELWALVLRYLTLREGKLHGCALTVLEKFQHLAGAQAISENVLEVAESLIHHPEPETDFSRGFTWLMGVASARFDELTSKTRTKLKDLSVNLATGESYQKDAVLLYQGVILRDSTLTAEVSADWANALATGLPLDCCDALFRSFPQLPEDVQSLIAGYFDSAYSGVPPEGFGPIYVLAADLIPADCWKGSSLQQHLSRALSTLPSKVSTSSSFLETILPALTKIYLYAPPSAVAASLRDTFSTAASYPAHHNTLHEFFAGTWPSIEQAHPGYEPLTIFTEAINVARRYPQEARKGLLRSLESMLTSSLIGPDQLPQLLEVACLVWQTHPAEAERFLRRNSDLLSPNQLANLADAISWDDDVEVAWIANVWEFAAQNLDSADAATLQILGKGQLRSGDLPDFGLSLWSKVLGEKAYEVIKRVAVVADVTEDGRRRLWRQLSSLEIKSDAQDLINFALTLLALTLDSETTTGVNLELRTLCEQISDQDSRAIMASTFLKSLPTFSSTATKANLADLAYRLGTEAVLRLVDASTLSADDLEVIADKFGASRELKSLRKRFESR